MLDDCDGTISRLQDEEGALPNQTDDGVNNNGGTASVNQESVVN